MDLFWEKWESSGGERDVEGISVHLPQEYSAGAAPLETLARHEGECFV